MIVICVESSHAKGMGHLFRALNLRSALMALGLECLILTNPDNVSEALLVARGVDFICYPANGNWDAHAAEVVRDRHVDVWVNDRLDTTMEHAQALLAVGTSLVTFDDFGAGARLAHINVAGLSFVPAADIPGRRVLRGPEWLVLPEEIASARRVATGARRLIISLGGSDTHGGTLEVIQKLESSWESITLILGPNFAHAQSLATVVPDNWVVKKNVPSLIHELLAHDVAITGGGLTAFESSALGLPTLIVACEDFEIPRAQFLADWGCARYAGPVGGVSREQLNGQIDTASMSRAGLRLPVAGAHNVASEIAQLR